jgi:hypothetical protein
MSQASGNARGIRNSSADVSFVQQHGHNQAVQIDNVTLGMVEGAHEIFSL